MDSLFHTDTCKFLAGNQYNIMITITIVWLCLIAHVVYGTTTITVNNNGSDEHKIECCRSNKCLCSSFSYALKHMQDHTVVNITSKIVTLNGTVGMGNLNNITIIGNGATIMCNNTGGVYCESCSDIVIMGITWYQCGGNDPMHPSTQIPALNFTIVSNMNIHQCTFQNSLGCPVYIQYSSKNITIKDSYFVDNIFNASQDQFSCAGIYIRSRSSYMNIVINSCGFCNNGCDMSNTSNWCHHYGAIILIERYCELANVVIDSTDFSNNSAGLYLFSGYTESALVQLSNINVHNNTANGIIISASSSNNPISLSIDISFATFTNNVNALSIITPFHAKQLKVNINIHNSIIDGNTADDVKVFYTHAKKLGVLRIALMSGITSVTIANCRFHNNLNGAVGIYLASSTDDCESRSTRITFTNVTIYNTTAIGDIRYVGVATVSIVTSNIIMATTKLTNVSFISNNYSRFNEKVLLIKNNEICDTKLLIVYTGLTDCTFDNNTAYDYVVLLRINANTNGDYGALYNIQISKCNFNDNFGGKSIVCVHGPITSSLLISSEMILENSTFMNNIGTALYCIIPRFIFSKTILFINNTGSSGAAIYFEEVHSISSDNAADVQFVNNSAVQRGGALYFNLVTDYCNVFSDPFNASFFNNSANIAGNSIYFSIPHSCQIITNMSDKSSLLYIPKQFEYFQPFYITGSPVVTSPYNVKLDPPAIAIQNSNNDYAIQQSKMLGELIQFNSSVLDYFNSITEPVIFSIDCKSCGDDYGLSTHQITVHNRSLNELKVFSKTSRDVTDNTNVSLTLLSFLPPSYKSMSVSLTIELLSCHSGYLFDKLQLQCICYPYSDIIHCIGDHSEIKIGYWIGFLTEQHYTSSICPSNYCNFVKRTETSVGYYDLPRTPDGQCSSHRTGVACGECKPGYTLAYDSPECINTDKCSAGMTILVIVLTILYWIGIVAVVFGLMYFLQFQISSGYAYGIVYYYSIVDILLGNNISEEVFQLVAVLSSFAKLTPRLFGQLCLVEGLSGIDQQFIHYTHALAVTLIVLIIVVVTKYSPRLALFVSRCIICVICLLLLLSYTSLASTSLQLLRPLTFQNVDEVRTYSSPDIKYFTGRHLAYAIVAILCEVIIVIGLPLLLLLEPLLSRKISFVKVKPLLDQFQGCYKDKYRWFAVYYLICRQVIILIVYVGNGDYYNKLYYLQTACIIIAMIHGWIQPYKKKIVNGLDGAILLILVLVVNLNTFTFLSSISSQLSIVLIILPLFLLCLIAIRKLLIRCYDKRKKLFYLYNPVDANEEFEEEEENDNYVNEANNMRFAIV